MKLTKRIISLFMAMLMLCSGMAITASATTGGTTETVLYTLDEKNCYVDLENIEIFVKAATVEIDEEEYEVVFSAVQSDDKTKSPRTLKDTEGNTILSNLTTGKTYEVSGTVKKGETETRVTNIFKVEVLNSKNAPAKPGVKKITATSIEIASVSGCEYKLSTDEAWGSKTIFEDLKPSTTYKIEIRYKKTATHYASPAENIEVTTLALGTKPAPDSIKLVDKTDKTITVVALQKVVIDEKETMIEAEDVEYSINNGTSWQSSGHFTGLTADKTYPVIARFTFDKTEQEANPACAPFEFKTNTRASYPADIKNCTFKASEGDNYANEPITITITGDAPSKYSDTQYGDTRYVAAYFCVGDSTDPITFKSTDNKTFTANFIPGEGNANKTVKLNVYYSKEKCIGEDENGEAQWVAVGEYEIKTYSVKVGEVYGPFTNIKNFFLDIFNVLFNTLPAKINDLIKGVNLEDIFEGLAGLVDMLGGMDLGGMLGGETK